MFHWWYSYMNIPTIKVRKMYSDIMSSICNKEGHLYTLWISHVIWFLTRTDIYKYDISRSVYCILECMDMTVCVRIEKSYHYCDVCGNEITCYSLRNYILGYINQGIVI